MNTTVALSTSLYEANIDYKKGKEIRGGERQNEEERQQGDEIKRGVILQQEMKNKAGMVEQKGEKTGNGKLSVRNCAKYRSLKLVFKQTPTPERTKCFWLQLTQFTVSYRESILYKTSAIPLYYIAMCAELFSLYKSNFCTFNQS